MSGGMVFGAIGQSTGGRLANPERHPRLVKGGKVLALAPSLAIAEETRKRWAEFGLEAEVMLPTRKGVRS